MKILLISAWKPRKGGVVTRVENLVKNSRNDFSIITYRIINLPVLRAACFLLLGFIDGVRRNFDVIHAHYALPQGLLGLMLKRTKRKPLVVTVHGSDITILGRNRLARVLVKRVLLDADKIIAVSDFLKGKVLDFGISQDKVKVIYGGVDKSREVVRAPFENVVTFVGGLVPQKGVDVLIEACGIVRLKIPIKLLVVGDGSETPKLKHLSRKLGVDAKFVGYQSNLMDVFKKTSVLALPSREEGFGLVLLEAMAAGVPVVASNVGGIPEIVENNINGILVERDNPTALADAIHRVITDGNFRKKIVKNGREKAGRFSWRRTANEVDSVYEDVKNR